MSRNDLGRYSSDDRATEKEENKGREGKLSMLTASTLKNRFGLGLFAFSTSHKPMHRTSHVRVCHGSPQDFPGCLDTKKSMKRLDPNFEHMCCLRRLMTLVGAHWRNLSGECEPFSLSTEANQNEVEKFEPLLFALHYFCLLHCKIAAFEPNGRA